jgi:hypothetical protein
LLPFALACTDPDEKPGDTADPVDTADTSDTTTPDDTDPAVPIVCDAVVGTPSVFLVGRADGALVRPGADEAGEDPYGLAGPDSLGRYYLSEPTGVVKRSDDGGCSWVAVGTLPGGRAGGADTGTADTGTADTDGDATDTGAGPDYVFYDLSASPASPGVYAYAPEHLLVSTDGRDWETRTAPLLRTPYAIVIDPTDPARLRAYGAEGLVTSTDAGATWTTTAVPDAHTWYNIAIDAADIDRVALSHRGLWVATDAATWTQRDAELQAVLAWDAGDLWAAFADPDTAAFRVRRSVDAGVTFTDLPVEDEPDAGVEVFAVDAGLAVVAGYHWGDGGADVKGRLMLTSDAGALTVLVDDVTDARALAFGEDRVLAAFQRPGPDTPD